MSCDREFTDCRLQTCFVQSPNFPGVYPRNRRCLYHVSTRQPFIKVNHVRLIIYNHPKNANEESICRCSFSLKTESSTLTAKDATITSCAPSDLLAKKLALTILSGLFISDRNLSFISNLIPFFFVSNLDRVYDGNSESAVVIGTFCGIGRFPFSIVGTGTDLLLEFVSSAAGIDPNRSPLAKEICLNITATFVN